MQERVRICDIAKELGLSTATVSNVIHGKTNKVSDETVQRVTALLESGSTSPAWRASCWPATAPGSSACSSTTIRSTRGTRCATAFASVLLPLFVCEASWSLGENVCAAIYGRMGTEQKRRHDADRAHTGTGDRRAVRPVAGCGRDRRKASWRRGLRWGLPGGEAADGLWRGRSLRALRRGAPGERGVCGDLSGQPHRQAADTTDFVCLRAGRAVQGTQYE